MQKLGELQTPGTGRREAGSVRQAEFRGCRLACGHWWREAEIMMSVEVIV
jgi:hypothetical protein